MIQLPDIRFQSAENSQERDVVLREADYVQMIDRLIELESLLNGLTLQDVDLPPPFSPQPFDHKALGRG